MVKGTSLSVTHLRMKRRRNEKRMKGNEIAGDEDEDVIGRKGNLWTEHTYGECKRIEMN